MKSSFNRKNVSHIGQLEKHRDHIGKYQSEELERAKNHLRREAAHQAAEEQERAAKRRETEKPYSKTASWALLVFFVLVLIGLYIGFKLLS